MFDVIDINCKVYLKYVHKCICLVIINIILLKIDQIKPIDWHLIQLLISIIETDSTVLSCWIITFLNSSNLTSFFWEPIHHNSILLKIRGSSLKRLSSPPR